MGQDYESRIIAKAQSTGKFQEHGGEVTGNELGKTGSRVSA